MDIEPLTPEFVAEINAVDVRRIGDAEFEALYEAWLTFGVLRLRGQQLDEDALQTFSARFGPLEEVPLGRLPAEARAKLENRFVTQLSNIMVDGKRIGGLGNAEAAWHSDMTYLPTLPPASVLYGVIIPERGGDTYFADQNAAYAALPERLRERIANLSIKHDAAHTSIGSLRPGFEPFDDPRDAPGATHPIVRVHEETGRAALYLGRRDWASIPELPPAESEALLDELWRYAARDEYVWRQEWQPGDLIIWDNRRVLHRRDGFPATSKRLMKRCQVLARVKPGQQRGQSSHAFR